MRGRLLGLKRDQESCRQEPSVARLKLLLTRLSSSYRKQGVELTKGLVIVCVKRLFCLDDGLAKRNLQTLERTNMIIRSGR